MKMTKCNKPCEVYSRVVGYHRPIMNWNLGAREQFKDRKTFDEKTSLSNEKYKEINE